MISNKDFDKKITVIPSMTKYKQPHKRIIPNKEQKEAINMFIEKFKTEDMFVFFISGGGGTGKTYTASEILDTMVDMKLLTYEDVLPLSYTGKAAGKMKEVFHEDVPFPTTIHSTVMRNQNTTKGEELDFIPIDREEFEKIHGDNIKLIIIDEISMVNEELFNLVLKLNIPILILGDLEQSSPIEGKVTKYTENPDYTLTICERFEKGSKVLELANLVRNIDMEELKKEQSKDQLEYDQEIDKKLTEIGTLKKYKKYTKEKPKHLINYFMKKIEDKIEDLYPDVLICNFDTFIDNLDKYIRDDIFIICGYNRTRLYINQLCRIKKERFSLDPIIRKELSSKIGYDCIYPQVGEPIHCMKTVKIFNEKGKLIDMISNGDNFILKFIHGFYPKQDLCIIDIQRIHDGTIFRNVKCRLSYFYNINDGGFADDLDVTKLTFNYINTGHKNQGSDNKYAVPIFDWSNIEEMKKWFYTAVTRARSKVIIVKAQYFERDSKGKIVMKDKNTPKIRIARFKDSEYNTVSPDELKNSIRKINSRIARSKKKINSEKEYDINSEKDFSEIIINDIDITKIDEEFEKE